MIHNIEISTSIRRKSLGLALTFGVAAFAFAQQKVSIEGKVVDKQNQGIPYASITFKHKTNAVYSDAVLADEKGNYKIEITPANYDITIEAIDFKDHTFNRTITSAGNFGNIKLDAEPSMVGSKTKNLETIVITATAKPYKVELDKKTYDPSQDVLSKGGNLQDVLSNVPSVSVDTDGTVSMRGNSNIRFLINGKPSSLLGIDDSSALQSIPADQIERIEVITNPSSKFEASGTAGILNIILKKSKGKGFNGSVEGALGYFPATRLNANLGWTKGAWTWFVNGGGGYNERRNTRWNKAKYFDNLGNISQQINQDSENVGKGDNYNATAGFNVNLSEKASFNMSAMIRHNIGNGRDLVSYNYLDANNTLFKNANRLSLSNNKGTALQGDVGFDYKFNNKGHNLFSSFSIQEGNNDSDADIVETSHNIFTSRNLVHQITKNNTTIGKIDYELPIGENSRFEAGYRFDRNRNDYDYGVLQSTDDITFTPRLDFTSRTIYQETFNAGYAQFKSKVGRLGYQLGVRAEHSDIIVEFNNQVGTDSDIHKKYLQFFPSVFLSYDIDDKNNQLLLNYSRRINRPRSFFLIPFNSFRQNDDRNQFYGNPDLNPEYVNSFELGYAIQKRKFTINPTLYYRHTTDETQVVVLRESETSDILVSRPYNIGSETQYGLDLNLTADLFSWWKVMSNINLFRYESKGQFFNERLMSKPLSFDGKGFSTDLRLTNTFKLNKTTNFQLQGHFNGGEKTASSERLPNYAVNFGANKTIWNGNGTIAFNIQDIFNTRGRRMYSYGSSFEREGYMQFMPRQFMLSFTYRFKQGEKVERPKQKKDINANTGGSDEIMY